jgi:hypothetical protein
MADPVSMAASIVGIISFAQGLIVSAVKFYAASSARNEDFQDFVKELRAYAECSVFFNLLLLSLRS